MLMQVGDRMQCDHCRDAVRSETLENGSTVFRDEPVTHPIEGFINGRPILRCPSLYTDQIHESGRMRLLGTLER